MTGVQTCALPIFPDALTNMTSLQVLDVSSNNLTGLIPKFGDSMKLTTTGNPLIGKSTPSSGSGGSYLSGSNGTSPSGNTAVMGSSGTSILPGMIARIVIAVIVFLVVMYWSRLNVMLVEGTGDQQFH